MLKSLGPIVATAIVVLFLLVSAVPLMHWFTEEGRHSTLVDNRASWDELGIESYRLDLEYELPGARAARRAGFVIRDGRVVERSAAGGTAHPVETIDGLFDQVEAAIRAAPDRLTVTYDDNYRFPRSLSVDPDDAIAGDESRIDVVGFDPRAGQVERLLDGPAPR